MFHHFKSLKEQKKTLQIRYHIKIYTLQFRTLSEGILPITLFCNMHFLLITSIKGKSVTPLPVSVCIYKKELKYAIVALKKVVQLHYWKKKALQNQDSSLPQKQKQTPSPKLSDKIYDSQFQF